jgi:hypothetical protein
MSSEKIRILEMIQEGKITAEEGMDLLNALSEQTEDTVRLNENRPGRFLRIRVDGDKAKKVNVNIPLSLVRAAGRLVGYGMAFVPKEAREEMEKQGIDLSQIDIKELISQIDAGLVSGRLVDIDTEDPEEGKIKVEVFVD